MRLLSSPRRLLLTCLLVAAGGAALVPAALAKSGQREAANEDGDEIDPLALAALLLSGGDAEKALAVLDAVDLATVPEDFDKKRFFVLQGFAALKLGRYADAERDLQKAIGAGEDRPEIQVQLARAAYGASTEGGSADGGSVDGAHAARHCRVALAALAASGEAGRAEPGLFAMTALCQERLGHPDRALLALRAGQERFSDDDSLLQRELQILAGLGLFQEARQRADVLLERPTAEPVVTAMETLRQAGARREAVTLGEAARLSYPGSTEVLLSLGRAWADEGKPVAAASVFERLAALDPTYTADVAELYRRAGRLQAALLWNARVPAEEAKVRQRFGLLVEAERYEEAA